MSIPAFLEIMERTRTGPIITLRDWDTKIIPKKTVEKAKEHGLLKTFDSANPINTDDGLADEFFRAGYELALDVGVFCPDTERVIKVSEEELKEALKKAPREVPVGKDKDRVVVVHRQPEDRAVPHWCAPPGIVVSEDIWVPCMQGIIQLREVDMFQGASLATVLGKQLLSKTPFETVAGRVIAQYTKEAMWRAGRPGMGTTAVISSVTEYGNLGAFGIPGGFDATSDIALVLNPAELKLPFASLHKIAQAINCGGRIMAGMTAMIGGYAGPPESTILSMIAAALLEHPVHQTSFSSNGFMDVRYNGNCGREGIWAISVAHQALSRNTHIVTQSMLNQVAGPCTEMMLYESAVGMMDLSVTGLSMVIGPRSAGGRFTDYLTPLETRFCGEVLKACAGMKRSDANEIAKKLIPTYENNLRDPPKGKSFRECYDSVIIRPSEEWLELYKRVKKEVMDLGIPLD